jgi:hypothetical protein
MMRQRTLEAMRTSSYRVTFDSAVFRLPPGFPTTTTLPAGYRLSFDFAPIDTLLAIVTTANITPAAVLPRISTHPFDALIAHHSQSFYPVALSRELLALNLSHAASTQPLDRLYAYAAPMGLLHYADLRTNAKAYREMIGTLKSHERAILAHIATTIVRYAPPGTTLARRVSFFVADWSDGWGASDITAVDLEYYKGDLPRLVDVLLHETFHAAQGAIASASPSTTAPPRTIADSMLADAAQYILIEGTANFVAPATDRTAQSAAAMADSGTALLATLGALANASSSYDRAAAQAAIDKGVAGGGPFYWLGAAMARVLVDRDGPQAIGKALQGSGIDFLRRYIAVASRDGGQPRLLPPAIVSAVGKAR